MKEMKYYPLFIRHDKWPLWECWLTTSENGLLEQVSHFSNLKHQQITGNQLGFVRNCLRSPKTNLPENTGPFFFQTFSRWVFPKIGVPQNGWFRMENPIKMNDLGENPPFKETPRCLNFFFLRGKIGDVDCSNGEIWSWTTGLHGSGAGNDSRGLEGHEDMLIPKLNNVYISLENTVLCLFLYNYRYVNKYKKYICIIYVQIHIYVCRTVVTTPVYTQLIYLYLQLLP